MINITTHAAQRYQERIAPHLTIAQAREATRSHSAAILTAHEFGRGRGAILTGNGAKLVIDTSPRGEVSIVTVKQAHEERRLPVPDKMLKRFGKLRRQRGRA